MGREKSLIATFRRFLKVVGVRVERAYLFGSRISGEPLKYSDLDAVIVSNDFEGQNFFDRMSFITKKWFEKDGRAEVTLEPLCYTPKEFTEKSKRIGLVSEAVKTGIRIV